MSKKEEKQKLELEESKMTPPNDLGADDELKTEEQEAIEAIRKFTNEDDDNLGEISVKSILGGDFLTADMVRRQIWLFMLMVVFTVVYVAFRYQCQQDLIAIDKLEKEVLDAKYKALSCSSTLTERCRESHVLEALKQNKDSLLHVADQPPYIIYIDE